MGGFFGLLEAQDVLGGEAPLTHCEVASVHAAWLFSYLCFPVSLPLLVT